VHASFVTGLFCRLKGVAEKGWQEEQVRPRKEQKKEKKRDLEKRPREKTNRKGGKKNKAYICRFCRPPLIYIGLF